MENKTKRHILSIINYALSETSVEKAFRQQVSVRGKKFRIKGSEYDLGKYEKIYVLGSGKASYMMASSLNRILGRRIDEGLVIYPKKKKNLGRIRVEKGTHPNPSEQSLESTKKLLRLAGKTTPRDLTIYLLSGGTSSLLCYPSIELKKFIRLNRDLLKSKRNIKQVNRIRRKYSRVKGGRLVDYIKGRILNLVVSDVVGDPLEFIGSGPLYSPGAKKRVRHFVLLNNRMLLEKAREKARELGYRTRIVFPDYEGTPGKLSLRFRMLAKKLRPGSCLISGGELASEVRGKGRGGPNQEFVLRCLGIKAALASIDSDGLDGNSVAAGAFMDRTDYRYSRETVRKYLRESNSYEFFRKSGGSIKTGPTGNNLNDLRVMLRN